MESTNRSPSRCTIQALQRQLSRDMENKVYGIEYRQSSYGQLFARIVDNG